MTMQDTTLSVGFFPPWAVSPWASLALQARASQPIDFITTNGRTAA